MTIISKEPIPLLFLFTTADIITIQGQRVEQHWQEGGYWQMVTYPDGDFEFPDNWSIPDGNVKLHTGGEVRRGGLKLHFYKKVPMTEEMVMNTPVSFEIKGDPK